MDVKTLSNFLPVLLVLALARRVLGLKCYTCDNSMSPACGPEFKAYQFDAKPCRVEAGIQPICGKQVQPPGERGWVGVIRSCYTPGTLAGLNSSNGCQYYHMEMSNFTALYCFCDTDNCNHANTPLTFNSITSLVFVIFSFFAFTFNSYS